MAEQNKTNEPKVPPAPKGMDKQVRVSHIRELRQIGRPIVVVTAYDAFFGKLADQAGVDIILVGDSVGNVVHGFDTTIPVTMDMMVMHTQAVVRGAKRPLIVTDMPFLTYQCGVDEAVRNAARLVQEGGAHAVKLEGGGDRAIEAMRAIVDAGIPVMGHVGLLPQSVHAMSGYRKQGMAKDDAERVHLLARAQQEAGAFAIVLEYIPLDLASKITDSLYVPTIGIGAGNKCDGQVLVMHDILGFTEYTPPFAKQYANLKAGAVRAFRKYARDVRERLFPE